VRLRIAHTTTFRYDEPVSEAYMEMRLTPLNAGGQRCESFRLTTDPPGEVRSYVDRFGNRIRHFDTLNPHDRLLVSARSEVSTPEAFVDPVRELSPLDAFDYLQPTPYAPDSEAVRRFALGRAVVGDARTTANNVLQATHGALAYTPGATTVKTTADEALAAGRGVCQDFTHLMIAACRVLGLPARYVSGYVFAPQRGTAAASHAWMDVFVAGEGWLSLDPTHGQAQTDHYVRLATGRDYADVPPTRGVYKGTGREEMAVDVSVERI
jgi:transglutaminase-like putative cysteine protease